MIHKRRFFIILCISLLVLCGLATYFWLKLSPNGLPLFSTGHSVTSEVPYINISIKNKTDYEKILKEFAIADTENVEIVNVRIVKDIQDPIYSQVDDENKKVISSTYALDDKVATIYISPGDFVVNETTEIQTQWIESEFWRVAELIMKRNVGNGQRGFNPTKPGLFIINTK